MAAIIGDLDELTGLIRRAARQEALELQAAAGRDAQQVQEQANSAAERLRAEILAAVDKELAEERRRRLAQAALAAQREHLMAREELLELVWAEAERELRLLPNQPTYGAVLRRLALAAAQVLGLETVVLAADPVGHNLLTQMELAEWSEAAQAHFVCAEAPATIWGGLLAWDEGVRRQVDGSFATRLTLARSELREQVALVLKI